MSLSGFAGTGKIDNRLASTKRFDLPLFLSAAILLIAGLLTLYSESIQHDGGSTFKKQLMNFGLGLVPFGLFALSHPHFWRRHANIIYILNCGMLASVLVIGKRLNGAQRWIGVGPIQIQPSEFAKFLLAITICAFFANRMDEIKSPKTFLLSLLHVSVPALLIFKQPHFAAMLVLVVIWLAASLVGEVPLKFFGIMLAVVVAFGIAAPMIPGVLKDYQKERWKGFLMGQNEMSGPSKGPGKKARDISYQTDRAAIAFGVGGVSGSGFLKGEQKQAHFVPYQSSDFVFTVVGEEGGLIGCGLVLLTFGFFFFRAWLIMLRAQDKYYQMLVGCIIAMLAFHMTVNLWMVLKLIPVAGLWLPFFSAGGSALWLCMACVGMLLNISSRAKPILF